MLVVHSWETFPLNSHLSLFRAWELNGLRHNCFGSSAKCPQHISITVSNFFIYSYFNLCIAPTPMHMHTQGKHRKLFVQRTACDCMSDRHHYSSVGSKEGLSQGYIADKVLRVWDAKIKELCLHSRRYNESFHHWGDSAVCIDYEGLQRCENRSQ